MFPVLAAAEVLDMLSRLSESSRVIWDAGWVAAMREALKEEQPNSMFSMMVLSRSLAVAPT